MKNFASTVLPNAEFGHEDGSARSHSTTLVNHAQSFRLNQNEILNENLLEYFPSASKKARLWRFLSFQ